MKGMIDSEQHTFYFVQELGVKSVFQLTKTVSRKDLHVILLKSIFQLTRINSN